ncbi:MAG: hypothetical protein OXL35_09045 [Chloroflexota bacterium]|nr:hypothetical protein [Chloroflexota bacterium]
MREHEVPTHVQAEDRVLLGFTFPQVVAMTAVCALSYGAYRYAPVGPSEVRIGIAVLFGLIGLAAVVGKIGGRRLPLVAADLLKYRLGARLYVGPPSQLVRSEPPAPQQPAKPVKTGPGPLRLMAKKAGRTLRGLRPRRKSREKTGGRMPFRPHRWFGKPRKAEADKDGINGKPKDRRRKRPRGFLPVMAAVALAAAVATVPQSALADGHEPWRDEIEFEITEPVEGRRIFVEGLSVSGDRALVTLRAATDVDIRIRAFGGPDGTWLRFYASDQLEEGEIGRYRFPLHGYTPSLTVSWEDGLGQAGAVTVEHDRIPHPLPGIEGELCDLRMTSLGWTPRSVSGVVESQCVPTIKEAISLQTVSGHESVTETALIDAQVTGITGTLSAATGASTASVPFVANGETRFTLPVGEGQAVHAASVDVSIEASQSIPIPPLTVLTHHPERIEQVTKTVHLYRPGDSDYDSETVTVTHDDGSTSSATATAHAYVPSTTIARDVTVDVLHPEHVKAEVVDRQPIGRTRVEALALASGVGSDDPFEVLTLPEPEPEDPPGEQEPAGGLQGWFDWLGWEWPW